MPKPTYVQINTITLAAATTSITFSNIPQNYRDLVLVYNGQFAFDTGGNIRLNSDSGSNYSNVIMRNNNDGVQSSFETGTAIYASWSSTTSGTRFQANLQIFDYSVTDKHKSTLLRNAYVAFGNINCVEAIAGRWGSTSAVTSATVSSGTNGFSSGFTFTLYGIEA
jgi:hypothetical protein